MTLKNIAHVTVNDNNKLATNVVKIVVGIYDKNLPIVPGSTSSGIYTQILISDVLIFADL